MLSIDDIKEVSMKYGLQEHFDTLIKLIHNINSLKSLQENVDNFYPTGYIIQYKKDINDLIKSYTLSLDDELKRLSIFYSNFDYKEDKE